MPDNLTDLKTAHDGLPCVSTWNTDKYMAGWQVQQVRNGRRFVPCLPLPAFNPGGYRDAANPKFIDDFLNKYADDLRWIGEQGLPICLRFNNLCQLFKPEWDSKSCVQAGVDLANSPYMMRLRELVPSPAWVQIADNNEGCTVHNPEQYHAFGYGFHSTAWPDSDFALIGYGNPLKDKGYRYDANRLDLDGYTAEARCFDSMSPSMYSEGKVYGNFSLLWPAEILNMIPQWEWAEANTGENLSREVSLKITSNAFIAGALVHEPMTSARYATFATWLLWSIREPGIPTTLRWFQESGFGPDRTLGTEAAGEYLQAITDAVDRICENPVLRDFWLRGNPVVNSVWHPTDIRLAKLGYLPYPRPGDADNRWRVLTCSANNGNRSSWKWDDKTNTVIGDPMRVWAVATELNGQWLVYAWSPFKNDRPIEITIPGHGSFETIQPPNPGAYWIVKPSGLSAERLEVT